MTLSPGFRLGRYEVVSRLGAGAMGEVYRARDRRLGRDAALKVLPTATSSDTESLLRFEQESRSASALNHPNIVTVYDVGSEQGISYIAMEVVEGTSLRDLLKGGRLAFRRVLEIGGQIAEGLAAAHDRGLVHRDLKPANLIVTREGLVKILDFGLAKLSNPLLAAGPGETTERQVADLTSPGAIVGTVGYMSPEQARGEPADFRSDQFSLGVLLYEMASGENPFRHESPVETLSAIVRDEPAPLESRNPLLPAPFCWIVERCLAKDPEKRYASSRDLARDLKGLAEHLSHGSSSVSGPPATTSLRRSRARRWSISLAAGVAVALAFLAGTLLRRSPSRPTFQQVTHRRGTIWAARFAPDGKTIIYAAAWEGGPFRLFRKSPESASAVPLDSPDSNLLAVSRSGELATALRYRVVPPGMTQGTLARGPLEGGAPREVQDDVLFADWSPDGKDLAVVRSTDAKTVLEYPLGVKLYETEGSIASPRVSPRGDLVAFLDRPTRTDDRGSVAVVDRSGHKRTLGGEWASEAGLAWTPRGDEVWFAGTAERETRAIRAATLSGKVRTVAGAPGNLTVQDISADGHVLVTREVWRMGILGRATAAAPERDLTWLDASLLTGLSSDGSRVLFTQFGESVDASYAGYLRPMDGSLPKRLGEGFAQALSPDGSHVLSLVPADPPVLSVLSTGAGQPRQVTPRPLRSILWASWMPDGKRLVIAGSEASAGVRVYIFDPDTGAIKAITPDGVLLDHFQGIPVSPDGRWAAAVLSDRRLSLFSIAGGDARAIPGLPAGTAPIGWTADGRFLLVFRIDESPARVLRVDPSTGEQEVWKTIEAPDPAGIHGFPSFRVTPDGTAYAYTYARFLSELFSVDGLH